MRVTKAEHKELRARGNPKREASLAAPQDSAMDYSIALQRAIEYHCGGMEIPESIARLCPYHARKLNARPPEIEAPNVKGQP